MNQSEEYKLPQDVVAALKAGRKIEAIKLVCEYFDVDLMQAKEIVEVAEDYIEDRSDDAAEHQNFQPMQAESSATRVVLVVVAGIIIYALYTLVSE